MDLNPFDQALIDAFLPLLYPPPSSNAQSFVNDHLASDAVGIDVASRSRLDHRTFYNLLLEWSRSNTSGNYRRSKNANQKKDGNGKSSKSKSTSKQNFTNSELSRQLKSSISLASQPLRKHISHNNVNAKNGNSEQQMNGDDNNDTDASVTSRSFYSTSIHLYLTHEEDDDEDDHDIHSHDDDYHSSSQSSSMWNDEEEGESSTDKSSSSAASKSSTKSTLGM